MDLLFLFITISLSFYFQLRLKRASVHPDSGQYLYHGFFAGRGKTYELLRWPFKKVSDLKEGFTGIISRLERIYNEPHKGHQPIYQKFAAYALLYWLYKIFKLRAKDFRLIFLIYNSLTIIGIYLIARFLSNPLSGFICSLFYVIYLAIPFVDAHQVHSEHYSVLPMAWGLLMIILGLKFDNYFLFFLAGILFFITFLFKVTNIVEIGFLFFTPMFFGGNFSHFLFIIDGFFLSLTIFSIILIIRQRFLFFVSDCFSLVTFSKYKKGIDFSVHQKEYNLYASSQNNYLKKQIAIYLPFFLQMLALFGGIFLFIINYIIYSPLQIFLISWLIIELIVVLIQGKFYFSHLVPLLIPSSLMAGLGIFLNQDRSIFIIYLMLSLITIINLVKWFFVYDPLTYQLKLYKILGHPHTLKFAATEIIADYLEKKTWPTDKIRMFGYDSELYILAKRAEMEGSDEDKNIGDPVQLDNFWGLKWRRWFINDLKNDPPRYIVDTDGRLNIVKLKELSGYQYELDKIFFNLFPVYKLEGKEAEGKNDFSENDLKDLTVPILKQQVEQKSLTQNDFIKYITLLFIEDKTDQINKLTNNGLDDLIFQWKKLNGYV